MMQIQARAVSTKRHTVGYKLGGQWRSRQEAVRLAKQGQVIGVTVRNANGTEYIASTNRYAPLSTLPVLTEDQIARNRR